MFSVMIVDDEKSVREGLKNYLSRQEGLFDEIFSAVNGEDALLVLEEKTPQVIITDINMPHIDGLEFIERLKRRNQQTQIIVLSGYDDFSYAQRAMRSGVEHYLLKPVDRKELVTLLGQMKEIHIQKMKEQRETEREYKHHQLLKILLEPESSERTQKLEEWLEAVCELGDAELKLEFEQLVGNYGTEIQIRGGEETDLGQQALQMIQTKWKDPKLTLNDIAGELYVSDNYLRYLIKEKTGMSFVKYLTDIRLECAASILSRTDRKVQEVAQEVGFEDAGYFTRVFTKKYACSPSKYRDKNSNFVHVKHEDCPFDCEK